jgi:DnaJ-class molecular chaperone
MGNLICDRSQVCLPLAATPIACQRCKGQGTTYRVEVHGADVIGGKRMTCPECGGEGRAQTGTYPPTPSNEPLHRY